MSRPCYCSLTLPHGAMCWFVVCDFAIPGHTNLLSIGTKITVLVRWFFRLFRTYRLGKVKILSLKFSFLSITNIF